jgi:hypothetical protein
MVNKTLGDEFHRLVAVFKAQFKAPIDLRAQEDDLARLANWWSFWSYQTCMEFGFYQTCEVGSECFYVQGLEVLEDFTEHCELYGQSAADVAKNIAATNVRHGGVTPLGADGKTLGSCVLWPNGEVDPWATLSVLESPGKGQPVLWVKGASHHAWTHPSASTDQPSVVSARKLIRQQVDMFLADESCSATPLAEMVV